MSIAEKTAIVFKKNLTPIKKEEKSEMWLEEKAIVYFWDTTGGNTMTVAERKVALSTLIACAPSGDPTVAHWKTFVFSLLTLSFASVANDLRSSPLLNPVILTKAKCKDLITAVDAYLDQCDELTGKPGANAVIDTESLRISNTPTWDNAAGEFYPSAETYMCASVEAITGFISLVTFLMGKRISDVNISVLTEKRPDAIINRYSLDDQRYILKGEGRLGSNARKMIDRVWVSSPEIRAICASFLIKQQQVSGVTADILSMTYKLLEWSGMTYSAYIHDLIVEQDWIVTVPYLRSSFQHWVDSLDALANIKEDMRPYQKMIYGDKFPYFDRKKLGPLITCAIVYALPSNPTLRNYKRPENTEHVVKSFLLSLEEHGYVYELSQDEIASTDI